MSSRFWCSSGIWGWSSNLCFFLNLLSATTHTFPQQLFSKPIWISSAWCLTKESAKTSLVLYLSAPVLYCTSTVLYCTVLYCSAPVHRDGEQVHDAGVARHVVDGQPDVAEGAAGRQRISITPLYFLLFLQSWFGATLLIIFSEGEHFPKKSFVSEPLT